MESTSPSPSHAGIFEGLAGGVAAQPMEQVPAVPSSQEQTSDEMFVDRDATTPVDDKQQGKNSSLLDAAVQNLLAKSGSIDIDAEQAQGLTRSHWGDLQAVQNAQEDFNQIFKDGDTWVIINIPPGHEPNIACNRMNIPLRQRLRFKSEIFYDRGFAKIGETLSNEKHQARLRRRLVNAGETIPEGVRFLVDLGPSTDDEVAPEQLEALSISKGLMRWYLASGCFKGVSHSIVGGHDDCCTCECNFLVDPKPDTTSAKDGSAATDEGGCIWDFEISPRWRKLDDYCEVRHAANAVRLLRAMLGQWLLLDSAPRVYTIAGLAKLWGFQPGKGGQWLQNEVYSWFYDDKNSVVVEALPEECLKIACNLQIPIVTRAAFRILVAEKAIEVASGAPQLSSSRCSVFGRPLGDVDEDMQTAIEHASQSMADRIKAVLGSIQSRKVYDYMKLAEWRQLHALWDYLEKHHPDIAQRLGVLFVPLTQHLIDAFHNRLVTTMATFPVVASLNVVNANQKFLTPSVYLTDHAFNKVYEDMGQDQKALTAIYWKSIRDNWPSFQIFNSYLNAAKRGNTTEDLVQGFNRTLERMLQEQNINLDGFVETIPPNFRSTPGPKHPSLSLLQKRWSFSTFMFYEEITGGFASLCQSMFNPATFQCEMEIPVKISGHLLLCLEDSEFRFLPLWAGGHDDGTGGVFTDALPAAEMGPNGPGPSYHTGHTVASVSVTDDLGFERLDVNSVTSGGGFSSNIPQGSNMSTVYNRFAVMAVDDDLSIAPDDSFSVNMDSEYDDAMHAVPTETQTRGQALYEVFMQEQGDVGTASSSREHCATAGESASQHRQGSLEASRANEYGMELGETAEIDFDDDDYDDDDMDLLSDTGTITPTKASVVGSDSHLWTVL